MGAHVAGLTEDQLRRLEELAEGYVIQVITQVAEKYAAILEDSAPQPQILTAAADLSGMAGDANAALAETVRPLVGEIYLSGRGVVRSRIIDATGVQIPPIHSTEAEAYLRTLGPVFDEIGEDLWDTTRSELADGYAAGESIPQLAQRVRGAARKSVKTSTLVARSAVVSAANKGSMDMARASGLEMAKEWMSTPDSRTRPTHHAADGQYVPINGEFFVGGYRCDYPGEWTLPPQERYNCRCTVGFVIPDPVESSPGIDGPARPRPARPVGQARDDRSDEWGSATDPATAMLVRDLRQIARDAKIPGASTANKRDLIYNIRYYEHAQGRRLLPPLRDAPAAPTVATPPPALSGQVVDYRRLLTDETPDGVPIQDLTVSEGYVIAQGRAYRINGITYIIETSGSPLDTAQMAWAKIVVEDLARAHAELPDGQYNDTYVWILGRNPYDADWATEYGIPGFRSEATAWDGVLTMWSRTHYAGLADRHTVRHETGHNLDSKQARPLGIGSDSQAWAGATNLDAARATSNGVRNFQRRGTGHPIRIAEPDYSEPWPLGVTDYGRHASAEDFAESFDLYAGGAIGEGEINGVRTVVYFRDLFPERAALFDRLLPEFGAAQRAEIARVRRALEVERAQKTEHDRDIAERRKRMEAATALIDIDAAISGGIDAAKLRQLLDRSALKLKAAERTAIVRAFESGDAAKIDVALRKIAKSRGVTLGPPVGRIVPATEKMRQTGVTTVAPGTDVRVVGRGADTRIGDNDISLIPTRVAGLTTEDVARARRRTESEASRLADFLATARAELAANPDGAADYIARLTARAGLRPAEEVALLRDRTSEGLARALAALQRSRKVKAVGTRNRATPFDPDSMDAGAATIEPGSRVKIVEPGYSIEVDGAPVIVRRAKVEVSAPTAKRAGRKVAEPEAPATADDAIIAEAEAEIARVRAELDEYRRRGERIPDDLLAGNLAIENQARARIAGARARKLADEPRSDDPAHLARQQQARIDVARQTAAMLGELDELRQSGASAAVMVERLRLRADAVGQRADITDELVAAVGTGDRTRIDAVTASLAERAGIRQSTGSAGGTERFDPRKHDAIAGDDIQAGAQVTIIRPGYQVRTDAGKWVNAERAIVESADGPAIAPLDVPVRATRVTFDDPIDLGYESLGDDELRELAESFLARPPRPDATRAEILAALRPVEANIARERRRIRTFRLNKAESLESVLGEADELAGKLASPDVAERAIRSAYAALINESGAWVPPVEFLEDVLVALRAGGLPAVRAALRDVGERYGLRADLSYGDVITGERFREAYGVADRIDRSAFEDFDNYVVVRRPAAVTIAGERTVVGRPALRRASERDIEAAGKTRRVVAEAPSDAARARALGIIRAHDAEIDQRVIGAISPGSRSLAEVYGDLGGMSRADFQLSMLRLAGRPDVELEIIGDLVKLRGAAREAAVKIPGRDAWIAGVRSVPRARPFGAADVDTQPWGRTPPGGDRPRQDAARRSALDDAIDRGMSIDFRATTADLRRAIDLDVDPAKRPKMRTRKKHVGFVARRARTFEPKSEEKIAQIRVVPEGMETEFDVPQWGPDGRQTFRGTWVRVQEPDGSGWYGSAYNEWLDMHERVSGTKDRWRKTATVEAYRAEGGERIRTTLADGTVETDYVAKPGQWIVRQKNGEVQIVDDAKFRRLYVVDDEPSVPGIEVPIPLPAGIDKMKVADLRGLAAARGLDVPARATKPQLLKALRDSEAEGGVRRAAVESTQADTPDVVSVRRPPVERAAILKEARTRFTRASAESTKGRKALGSVPLRVWGEDGSSGFEAIASAADRKRIQDTLLHYGGDTFQDINAWLRTGMMKGSGPFPKTESEIKQMIADLMQAFEASRLPEPITVYRGAGSGRSLFGPRESWPEDLSGFEWVDTGMFSTSTSQRVAEGFGDVQLRLVVPRGNRAIGVSGSEYESEVLLPPGARFRVVRDRGIVGGKRRLDVEIVPEDALTIPTDVPAVGDLATMKVAELRSLAASRGLDVPPRATKAQLLKALRASEPEAPTSAVAVEAPAVDDFGTMKVAELRSLATARGLDVSPRATKAQLLKALREPQPESPTPKVDALPRLPKAPAPTQAAKAINPNFGSTRSWDAPKYRDAGKAGKHWTPDMGPLPSGAYEENCTNVVYAFEMRMRGFDVEAAPLDVLDKYGYAAGRTYEETDDLLRDGWRLPDGRPHGRTFKGQKWRSFDEIDAEIMRDWPEGGRGFLTVGKHVFNVIKRNGRVEYIEAQFDASASRIVTALYRRKYGSSRSLAEEGRSPEEAKLVRLDDLVPTDVILEAVVSAG